MLEDRVIWGNKEILFTEIQSVKLLWKSTFATNGVIQVIVNNKVINLAYPHKSKDDGEKAFLYLQDNYGSKQQNLNRKSASDIQAEINSLPCKDDFGTI